MAAAGGVLFLVIETIVIFAVGNGIRSSRICDSAHYLLFWGTKQEAIITSQEMERVLWLFRTWSIEIRLLCSVYAFQNWHDCEHRRDTKLDSIWSGHPLHSLSLSES